MTNWTPEMLPDLTGQTYVITGANSGIGLTAARQVGAAGARVVMAVRDEQRGAKAAAGVPNAEVRRLDLADLDSVRAFADAFDGDVDVLINNAGIMAVPEGRTKDAFESQIGTNHLGHFALTNLLLPRVQRRVVTLSSSAHHLGKIDLDDLNWERRSYRAWRAYGQSKLANLLFTAELQRQLSEAGSPVIATAAHPGYASTNLQSGQASALARAFTVIGNRLLAQSAEQGAWPTTYASTADLPGNAFIGPGSLMESRGHPKPVGRSGAAADAEMARKLWALSERLTEVSFPVLEQAGS